METTKRRIDILFLAVALIHLVPLWLFPFFPTQDGPAHLETGYILANYHNKGLERIHEYIALKPTWSPNILTQYFLAGLCLLMSPLIAEKVLLSIYVLAFPFSFRYWLRRVIGRPHAAEFMIFPFIYNYFLHKGFFNFIFSLVGFFLIMGIYERNRDGLKSTSAVLLLFLVVINYFCHLVGAFYAGLCIGVLSLAQIAADFAEKRFSARQLLRRLAPVLLVGLPVVVFMLFFTQEKSMQSYRLIDFLRMPNNFFPPGYSIRRWLSFDVIAAFEPWENRAGTLPIILFGLCFAAGVNGKTNPKVWRRHDIYFILFLVLLVVFLCAPNMILSASVLNQRAAFFPYMALIIWFGATRLKPALSVMVIVLSLASSLTYFGVRYPLYQAMNNQYREFARLNERIENHSTVLPLILSSHAQYDAAGRPVASYFKMIEVFKHVSAYLALDKDIVEFAFYPANQPHFPIRFRNGKNPYRLIGDIESVPPKADFLPFAGTGREITVDYVVVWGIHENHFLGKAADHLKNQLKAGYDLIYASRDSGSLLLFRRKGFTPERSVPPG